MPVKKDADYFIKRAKEVHGDKYEYLEFFRKVQGKYIKSFFTIKCKKCGNIFEQSTNNHLKGRNCPKCADIARIKAKQKPLEYYIERAKEVHGDKYEYLDITYQKNINALLKIKCKKCGNIFEQTTGHHINSKTGCPECNGGVAKPLKYYIERAKEVHGDKYEYLDLLYDTKYQRSLLKLKCKKCGNIFEQDAQNHLKGHGCKICGFEQISKKQRKPLEYYIERAKEVHGDKFEYLDLFYEKSTTYLKIKCKEHDYIFTQTAGNHISHGKNGCPKCPNAKHSKPEFEIIEYLESLGITNIVHGDRKQISPYEIDIFLPDYNLGIEFNGLYWHSERINPELYHIENKRRLAENNGIQLLNIYEDDWFYKQDIIKSIIKNKLNLIDNKIYARKCELKEIDNQTYREFCINNHIMGYRQAKYKIGLFYNDDLVAVAGFSDNELIRYVIKQNTSVIGGLGKITKWFLSNINSKLFTYVDLDYFNGNSYKKVGFKEIGLTQPKYWYIKGNEIFRYSRQKFQKHKLKDLFDNFDENLTEVENCNNNGYYRLFGCSNLKLEIKDENV